MAMYVKCPLCGQPMRTINSIHLKRKHSMTMKEFKKRFPDQVLMTEDYKDAKLHGKFVAPIQINDMM